MVTQKQSEKGFPILNWSQLNADMISDSNMKPLAYASACKVTCPASLRFPLALCGSRMAYTLGTCETPTTQLLGLDLQLCGALKLKTEAW